MSSLILPPKPLSEYTDADQSPAQGRVATNILGGSRTGADNPDKIESAIDFSAHGLMVFYNLMNQVNNFSIPAHMEPVCRALTDERIKKLLIIIGPGSGKSYLISVSYIAYLLGCKPDYTIVGISAGEALMQGFQSAVMNWIEFSPAWKVMFPNVRPDKNLGWSTEAGMFVSGHRAGDPDASYIGLGVSSKRLTGVHGRIILGDDLHDKENSMSEDSCLRVRETFYKQIMGRADPQGARYIMVGRRWHQADIYGHLEETGEYVVMKLSSIRNDKELVRKDGKKWLFWDVSIPDGLECCFNDHLRMPPGANDHGISETA